MNGPHVRLAVGGKEGTGKSGLSARHDSAFAPQDSPTLRLAHVHGAQGDNNLLGQRGVEPLPETSAPALLISFFYLAGFLKNRQRYIFRDWAFDSGAYSAHSSGVPIDLADFIATAKRLLATDPKLVEVFALDVIGNHVASRKNCEAMWLEGIRAIPTFHYGSPIAELKSLAREYPKIAIGGCARMREPTKERFVAECFSAVWPKPIHGFGMASEKLIMGFPFHSVDASSWELAACGFGRWRAFGSMSVWGSKQNLRAEVEYYLKVERQARSRWAKEMARLDLAAERKEQQE